MAADRAVRHVTYLSAHGIDQAPPEIPYRAAELDVMGREAFTHSILRPAWFNQNFSEGFLSPVDDVFALPAGNGSRPLSMSKTSHRSPRRPWLTLMFTRPPSTRRPALRR